MINIKSVNDLENTCKALQDNTITATDDCPLELNISIEIFNDSNRQQLKERLKSINNLTKGKLIIKILFTDISYAVSIEGECLVNAFWYLINQLKLEDKIEVIIAPAGSQGYIEFRDKTIFNKTNNLTSLSIANINIECLSKYMQQIQFNNVTKLKKISITDIKVPHNNFGNYSKSILYFFIDLNKLLVENPNIKQCVVEFANKELMANFLQSDESCKTAEQELRETIKKNAATLEKLEETLDKIEEITKSIKQLEEKFPEEDLNRKTSTIQKEINTLLSKFREDLTANTTNFFENAKILEQQGNKNVYYYIAQYHTHYGDTQDYKKIFENLKKVTQQDAMYSKANEHIMHLCVDLSSYIAIFSPEYTTSETGEITLSPQEQQAQQKNVIKFAFYARKTMEVGTLNKIFKEYLGITLDDTNTKDMFTTVDFKTTDESLFEELIFSMVTFAYSLSQAAVAPVMTTASSTNVLSFSNGHTPKPTTPTAEKTQSRKRARSCSPSLTR